MIDISPRQMIATLTTAKGAHGVVVNSDSSRVYVTNIYDNSVSVVDVASNKVLTTIPVGEGPTGISFSTTQVKDLAAQTAGSALSPKSMDGEMSY